MPEPVTRQINGEEKVLGHITRSSIDGRSLYREWKE